MKINLIIPAFYPAVIYGGPIFSTLNACKELSKLDSLELYVSTTDCNMNGHLDVETDKFIEFKKNFYIKYYHDTWLDKISLPFLLNIWKDIKQSDLIHIQSIFSLYIPIALLYSRLFSKPVLLSPRGSFAPWILDRGRSKKKLWLRFLIRPFIKTICWHSTSKQEENEIKALFPKADVFIVPNGINLDEYKSINCLTKKEYVKKYTQLEIEPDYVIISMGRLHAKKGFDILIDAFYQLEGEFSSSVLLIAGDDETEKSNLEKQIRKLGLDNRVFFVGSISGQDKVDFLANADLFVLPSHNENFGNVYVESMAAGTPIVASTNTPWEEVVEVDCGKWVDNSVDETKLAIMEMLKKDRAEMRINSKALANKYDWKSIAVQFKNVFEKMLENK